jgi:hypothetical protein
MVLVWIAGILAIAGFGLVGGFAAAIPFALVLGLGTVGDTMWFALLQTRIPGELLGRVSSLDWMLSFALLPVSYALTGPLAAALGAGTLLVVAAVAGAVVVIGLFVALPGLRDHE